ncbi:MAG: hypothetical protein F4213_17185 [Boseongicola sp. SB0677_bin_26]|nr:hypothetical protein [Boseongicola sp. SB0665_bin_10]MYG27728.1 hypothetical protein [Boseongicola sp. SB0677_bin_26]
MLDPMDFGGSAYGRVSGRPDAEALRLGWRVAPDAGLPESLDHDFWLEPGTGDGAGIGAGLSWTAERAVRHRDRPRRERGRRPRGRLPPGTGMVADAGRADGRTGEVASCCVALPRSCRRRVPPRERRGRE